MRPKVLGNHPLLNLHTDFRPREESVKDLLYINLEKMQHIAYGQVNWQMHVLCYYFDYVWII